MPKPKPDDRSDNVDKLQEQVVNTIENLEEAIKPSRTRTCLKSSGRRSWRRTAAGNRRLQAARGNQDEYRYQQSLQQNKDE